MAKINGKFNEATRVAVTVKVATIFYFLVDSLWTLRFFMISFVLTKQKGVTR